MLLSLCEAGYAGCKDHADDPPFVTFDEAEAFIRTHPYYDGLSFHKQNDIAAELFRAADFMVPSRCSQFVYVCGLTVSLC